MLRPARPDEATPRGGSCTRPLAMIASLAVLVLSAGCAGSASPLPSRSALGSSAIAPATPASAPMPASTQAHEASRTSSMTIGRQVHTATLLADGRVLVVGGYDVGDLPLASANIFEPTTGTFSATGSLALARGLHTATLLVDGGVLVVGGGPASWVHPGPYLASAELYDPKTGAFGPTGSLATPLEDHAATLLRDGRVLITGGNDTGDHAVASAELYDPETGTFSPTGSMTTARAFHTATLLSDGRVLIAGGSPASWSFSSALAAAEIYDPKTGLFKATGPMTEGRVWHTATLLSDGRVLMTGGVKDVELASAEVYDPKTGKFSATGPMTVGRDYHTATLLSDGRVLVVGGGQDYTNHRFLASAELYDPKTGSFSATGSMTEGRTYLTATLLSDGRVLVAGGYGALAPLASAEIYDPRTGTFSSAE